MRLRPRHAYPAALRRGLPVGDINRHGSSPHKAGAHRNPAPIRQVRAGGLLLRGVPTLVCHVHLPVTLAAPRPSDGADPSRRCQGCFQPAGASPPVGLPSASPARCDEPEAVSFHHRTIRERLVALDVAAPGAGLGPARRRFRRSASRSSRSATAGACGCGGVHRRARRRPSASSANSGRRGGCSARCTRARTACSAAASPCAAAANTCAHASPVPFSLLVPPDYPVNPFGGAVRDLHARPAQPVSGRSSSRSH